MLSPGHAQGPAHLGVKPGAAEGPSDVCELTHLCVSLSGISFIQQVALISSLFSSIFFPPLLIL